MNAKILETKNLTVSFDGFKALNQLNFSMEAGELRVVIGPNGAGKTTFLDVITGKVKPTEGRVFSKAKVCILYQNIKYLDGESDVNSKLLASIST